MLCQFMMIAKINTYDDKVYSNFWGVNLPENCGKC